MTAPADRNPRLPVEETQAGRAGAAPTGAESPRYVERRRRVTGWRSRDILRTAALVIAMYLGVRLIWFANPLFLIAFLGLLFGLAVSSGVDRLERWRIPRGLGAGLIVLSFIGLLVAFGAWVAPTIRAQSRELQQRLPESIERAEAWINRHNGGLIGSVLAPVAAPVHHDSAQASPSGSSANQGDTSSVSPLRERISKQL